MVDEHRAHELLASCKDIAAPSAIRLSNKSFSQAAAEVIANKLKEFTSVTIADISDIIAGRPEDEALQVLTIICDALSPRDLVEVNVSDNALGRKGVIACQGILKGKNIKKLYFCNNGLSAEASELISDLVLADGCPPLEVLHFYNNMSGSAGAIASARIVAAAASQLSDFRYSATRSGSEGCMAIAEALCSVRTLEHLDVSDNSFGDEVGETLASALGHQINLKTLNLRDAGLGTDGVTAVCSAIKRARAPLQTLDLSGNDINGEVIGDVVNMLSHVPSLENLSIDDSEMELEGCRSLASAVCRLPMLKTLSICCSELTAACVVVIARAVSKLPAFETLSVDGNQICQEGIDMLEQIVEASGKKLGGMEDNDEDGDNDLDEVGDEVDENEDDEVKGLEAALGDMSVNK